MSDEPRQSEPRESMPRENGPRENGAPTARPQEPLPGDAAGEGALPGNALPGDPARANALPGDTLPGDPESKDNPPGDAATSEVAPEEPSVHQPSVHQPSVHQPSDDRASNDRISEVTPAAPTGDRPADTGADTVPVSAVPSVTVPPAGPAAGTARRVTGAGVMIAVLLAVFGFVLVVQLRSVSADPTLAAARQEDLVRILSDLQAREQRLREDISQLESSQRQLTSGVEGGQAALEEATRRADELGILAGSLPAVGRGLHVTFKGDPGAIKATAVLDAVQELRGASAEAMQISGPDGAKVRVVASTYFLDGKGGINVDGILLTGPYTIEVIGDPGTMRTALNIPGGVVELVGRDGGTVTIEEVAVVEVSARHGGSTLQYARPVS